MTFSLGSLTETFSSAPMSSRNSAKYLMVVGSRDNVAAASGGVGTDSDGYEIPIPTPGTTSSSTAPLPQLRLKAPGNKQRGTDADTTDGPAGHQSRLSCKSARNCSPPPTYSQIFAAAAKSQAETDGDEPHALCDADNCVVANRKSLLPAGGY